MRHRIAFASALVSALAACDDPASPAGPAATEPASLEQGGAQTEVAATAQRLVSGLDELQGSAVGPGGALFVTAPLTAPYPPTVVPASIFMPPPPASAAFV